MRSTLLTRNLASRSIACLQNDYKSAVFTDLRKSEGLEDVISWIQRELLFEEDAKSGKLDQFANQAISDFQAGKCKRL